MKYLIAKWKAIQEFCRSVDFFIVQEYKTLFKGGVFLLGVTLAGLSQIYPKLTEMDYAARGIQFEVEAQEKKKLSDIADCYTLPKKIDKCLLAKYQISSNFVSFKFSAFVTVLCFYMGVLLVFISMYGFLEYAKKTYSNTQNNA